MFLFFSPPPRTLSLSLSLSLSFSLDRSLSRSLSLVFALAYSLSLNRFDALLVALFPMSPLSSLLLQGYFAHKKQPLPQVHHRALSIGLLQGPTGGVFLMSEVPLYFQSIARADNGCLSCPAHAQGYLTYKKMHPPPYRGTSLIRNIPPP